MIYKILIISYMYVIYSHTLDEVYLTQCQISVHLILTFYSVVIYHYLFDQNKQIFKAVEEFITKPKRFEYT